MANSHHPDIDIDIECGDDLSDGEEGSCFYSAYGDTNETDGDESNKVVIVHLGKEDADRDCRICHLSLVSDDAIELGCCCKDDLAAAHKHCAETWFKIKGNKTCEICNSIVSNLVVPIPNETGGAVVELSLEEGSISVVTPRRSINRGRGCINGHRLLNFILACLVFAFVISWLFHFNIPS